MVKKYILSIDNEIKEYLNEKISLLEKQMRDEIFKTPLISSNKYIIPIVENLIKDVLDTTISLIDYYVEGIYDSGKNISRKKLKLKKQQPEDGQRYFFTENDKLFISRYKSIKLSSLSQLLEKSFSEYVVSNIILKMESKWHINMEDSSEFDYSNQELIDDEMQQINDIIKDCLNSSYEEVMDILARELLILFKRSQIEEYRNLGINVVTNIVEDESLCCPVCSARSGKISRIEDVVDDFGLNSGNQHAFCNYSIDPVISYQNQVTTIRSHNSKIGNHFEYQSYVDIDTVFLDNDIKKNIDFNISSFKFKNVPVEIEYRITKLIKKFQIYAKHLLKEINFIFVENITDESEWFKSVKEHYIGTKNMNDFQAEVEALKAQDNLKYKVASFDLNENYYVSIMSFDSQLVEEIITRKILKDSIQIDDWVIKKYQAMKSNKHMGNGIVIYQEPFISYLAQESPQDYLLESAVAYVNQPRKLKELDEEMFNYIKNNIFNNIQFFK